MKPDFLVNATAKLFASLSATGVALAADSTPAPASTGHTCEMPQSLDLHVADISNFVDPAELAEPLPGELEEIVVRGQRPEPLPEQRVIPQGLGAILDSLKNPLPGNPQAHIAAASSSRAPSTIDWRA